MSVDRDVECALWNEELTADFERREIARRGAQAQRQAARALSPELLADLARGVALAAARGESTMHIVLEFRNGRVAAVRGETQ